MSRGIIFKIKKYALHDGPGIRTTVFLKGCPLACWWCHNPEGQRWDPERMHRPRRANDGEGSPLQISVGQSLSVADLVREVEKDLIFYDQSGGGVTFSGGGPLSQLPFLKAALTACRSREIHTTVDTSGYAEADALAQVAALADLFLFDLKLIDDRRHRRYTGVSNRIILKNLRRLARLQKDLVIRFPLVPGITDGAEDIADLLTFVRSLSTIRRLDILPYHRIGDEKYRRLGMANPMPPLSSPDPEHVESLKKRIEAVGFDVRIGG